METEKLTRHRHKTDKNLSTSSALALPKVLGPDWDAEIRDTTRRRINLLACNGLGSCHRNLIETSKQKYDCVLIFFHTHGALQFPSSTCLLKATCVLTLQMQPRLNH